MLSPLYSSVFTNYVQAVLPHVSPWVTLNRVVGLLDYTLSQDLEGRTSSFD